MFENIINYTNAVPEVLFMGQGTDVMSYVIYHERKIVFFFLILLNS